jgi:hypothetical protein
MKLGSLDRAVEGDGMNRMQGRNISTLAAFAMLGLSSASCGDFKGLDPAAPARGPGQLVGNGDPVSNGDFVGGDDPLPEPRDVRTPSEDLPLDCTGGCRSYCDSLSLENPVNRGVCASLWGMGMQVRPIRRTEACRRLYADLVGRYPSRREVSSVCSLPTWGETVKELLATDEFVLVNQRRWADKLLYNNRAVNFERAFDMDDLVGKAYEGRVSWDQFAAMTSAHPVVMRRHDTANDRAAFLFRLFLGRPPYENERGDIARLYRLWNNGYWEHPHLGILPDAFIQFECVDDRGNVDPQTSGECTSILYGHNELTLSPDPKRLVKDGDQQGLMWAGFLKPEEWEKLQLPGRLIARQPAFWEHTVDEVLEQHLGYNLAIDAPEVRHELVKYLLQYNGDIRALHFAVATSFVYLQSTRGPSNTTRRWTYGPLKQIEVEGWIDSIKRSTGWQLSRCDHRLPNPRDYAGRDATEEGVNAWGRALVRNTRWELDDELEVIHDYRNLARTLGGCPSNEVGGRFASVSVLNTAVQEAFVAEVCGIGGEPGVPVERLLPEGMSRDRVLDDTSAAEIGIHNYRLFLSRSPEEDELDEILGWANQCEPGPCTAEAFARPMCFSTLSSSAMLFY